MKNFSKSLLSVAAAVTIAGATITTPLQANAWGDLSNGRASYTADQIDNGALGDKIVFNSISDGAFGSDEKNFVGARLSDTDNIWNNNAIEVENGKTYTIRLFVHNNSPLATDAIAKDVTTSFSIPSAAGNEITVVGYINSSNAAPTRYWDEVVFKSNNLFTLDYVEGSALIENNGMGKVQLSDQIVNGGTKIGYDSLNGEIPGCYRYSAYVTIRVKANFVNDAKVEKTVRKVGQKDWKETIEAKVGDEVEYQIFYQNTAGKAVENVMVSDALPTNMEYVKGSTMLYNTTNPNGIARDDTITTTGVNIGGYADNAGAYIRFRAKVVGKKLACNANSLVNWGYVTVNGKVAAKDDAKVLVNKICADTPSTIVNTGATSIVAGALGAGSIATALGYYISSRKKLM